MTERNYIVYLHYFPNKKRYIGITCQGTKNRWRHDGTGYKGQIVKRAIDKYGWNNILHFILYKDLTEEEAKAKEIELIAKYKSDDKRYGYNITAGGDDGGHHCTKVICINTNEIFDSIKKASQKYNVKMENIRACCKGETKTIGTHPNTNERLVWQYYEDYLIEPKDISHMDLTHNQNICPVKCIETNTIYNSITEASKQTGANKSKIVAVCKGKRKTAGGYHWEYASQ